jgi:hypothetical protein
MALSLSPFMSRSQMRRRHGERALLVEAHTGADGRVRTGVSTLVFTGDRRENLRKALRDLHLSPFAAEKPALWFRQRSSSLL